MTPKQVAFVGAACVTIGWLLASTMAPPVVRVQTRPEERAPRGGDEEPRFTEQLQLRLNEVRATPENRRNPFAFATVERDVVVTAPAARGDFSAATPVPLTPAAPVAPLVVLSGIGIDGDLRTAVLTLGDEVRIVKVNDEIDGHVVAEISESAVVLVRAGKRQLLRLPQ